MSQQPTQDWLNKPNKRCREMKGAVWGQTETCNRLGRTAENLVPGFFANFHEFAPADYRRLTGTGSALGLSDFVDRRRRNRLTIYNDYYRVLGLEDDLNINVRHGDVVMATVPG